VVRANKSFRHGIHPGEHKDATEDKAIERLPFPAEVTLPLSQHLGAPSKSLVATGDKVYRGQIIAEAAGFVSVPLHASATGTVTAIEPRHHPTGRLVESIVIECDPSSPQTLYDEHRIDWEHMSTKELLAAIQSGGFVGLGGAAFPTHVKLAIPEGKRCQYFLVNGAECEPYLTSDHRIMLEWTNSIYLGIRICLQVLGAEKAFIGVEDNKWDAIKSMREAMPADLPCEVVPLRTKYPQGAEKMLITAVLKREVPSGKLPIDAQVVVHNIGTIAGMGDYFSYGMPLIERVVTVTGPGIRTPKTVLAPVGTELRDVLEFCGGLREGARQVLFGGPMMGSPQQHLTVPILKGTSGILCLTEGEVEYRREYACIRCSSCLDSCPVFLNPSMLGMYARSGRYEEMLGLNLYDCMECGSCSYVCPSNIPLVQRFRVAKGILREEAERARVKEDEEREKAKEEAAASEAAKVETAKAVSNDGSASGGNEDK
jgi:electron transport complex protein RnfC